MLFISHVDSEKMEKNIMSDSVDIKFHDVEEEGNHLRFVCQKLLKEIVPGGSRVEVEEHSVKITLPKCTEDEHWSVLVIKKDKVFQSCFFFNIVNLDTNSNIILHFRIQLERQKEETWNEDRAGILLSILITFGIWNL